MKTIFIVFGATGDLAKRKLFPALYNIYQNKKDENISIMSIGRREFDDISFRNFIDNETSSFIEKKENFSGFLDILDYFKLDLENSSDYILFQEVLEKKQDKNTQIIIYLAISPEYFSDFINNYKLLNLSNVKVIFEKPFGTDLETARNLNSKIMEVFEEKEVYRIDHYVGKEAVQNILAFRFANSIFEAIWNNRYIDNIQITARENIGVGYRGGYYDKFGALRDMLQNHLFQVLSLVVMDPPSNIDAYGIMQEKLKVFKSINLGNNFQNNVIFAQYNGYLDEKGIEKSSRTETFVAMKLEIASWNFIGVPIYLRTGKNMDKKSTKIVVEFKEVPNILFKKYGHIEKNRIILEVQPNEGIDIHFNIKQNGNSKEVERIRSQFTKENESKEAYEKLLEDVIIGDKTLFTSWEMLEETWKIVDELVNCKDNCPVLYKYDKGTNGPEIAYKLLENDGKKWYE